MCAADLFAHFDEFKYFNKLIRNSIYSMNFACQLIRIVYRYSLKYFQQESSSIETSPPKIVDFESNFHDTKQQNYK